MKILLVEDEQDLAQFLQRGLCYEGYQVDHADDGASALRAFEKHSYDLVLLDLILPSMSGQTVLKEIRLKKINTPVIVMTAVKDMETKVKLLHSGADDYLVKPFSFVELVARVKSVMRRINRKQEPASFDALSVGDVELRPRLREVTIQGKKLKLRLKEYELLEYFLRHPDEVINRATLIEHVWNYNTKLLSNTVDSHISSLRRKIMKHSKFPFIGTIHGIGYLLRSS